MAGTCSTTIKLIGTGSLGIATLSLLNSSFCNISGLLKQTETSDIAHLKQKITKTLCSTRAIFVGFGSVSSLCLSLAFKYAPTRAKHPYLLYSAVAVPLAIISLLLTNYDPESKLSRLSDVPVKNDPPVKPVEAVNDDDSSQLGQSYIHVGDEEDSTAAITSVPDISEITELSIDQEASIALFKQSVRTNLEKVRFGYNLGSGISGFALLISVIGLGGELFL